jgi:hypothetical protein
MVQNISQAGLYFKQEIPIKKTFIAEKTDANKEPCRNILDYMKRYWISVVAFWVGRVSKRCGCTQ